MSAISPMMTTPPSSDDNTGSFELDVPSEYSKLQLSTAVGASVSRCAGWHVCTVPQAAPLASDEYVVPATHGAHVRSCVDEPSTVLPSPGAHVCHGVQLLAVAAEYVPLEHGVHAPLAAPANEPAAHGAHDALADDDA